MKELVRTNDPALLSFVSALLEDAGLHFFVADRNVNAVLGSLPAGGVLGQRVMVADDEYDEARAILAGEGLEEHLKRQ